MNGTIGRAILSKVLIPLRVIVAALALGPTIFLAIVLAIGPMAVAGQTLITWIALAFAAVAVVLRFVVPQFAVRAACGRICRRETTINNLAQMPVMATLIQQVGDAGQLVAVFYTRTILAAALIEGAAFFLIIAYLIEGSPWALGAAIAMIVAIALHIPMTGYTAGWIADQLRQIEDERALGRLC